MGVQFASKMGMKVTAVSTSEAKRELCLKELGAHEFLNMSLKEDEEKFLNGEFDLILNTGLAHDL